MKKTVCFKIEPEVDFEFKRKCKAKLMTKSAVVNHLINQWNQTN